MCPTRAAIERKAINLQLELASTHPQVSVGQVCRSGVRSIDGLLAINLDDAAVLDVSDILKLVEDVAGLILDQDGRVGRL